MRNFAAQSADIAQLLLGNYVGRVTENGSVVAADGETCHGDDSGRIAYALAALYATQQGDVRLISVPNLIDSVALCIAAQFHYNGSDVEGCIYAMMALLTMGLNLARNAAWSRFQEETQKMITAWSRKPLQIKPHQQIFAVIHGIVAYSLGFTSKDETDRRIDQWLRSRSDNCTGGFMDYSWQGIGGRFDGRAIEHYILLREALQRHGNVHTRERRLPTLRTHMQRYLRLMPDLVRDDGTNWAYGSTQGCSGTLNGISFLLYAFVDNWIETTKQAVYVDALRKLIQHFFMQYLDQENCCICIRDGERNENGERSTVGINFDAIRQILLWSQWAKTLKISLDMGNETT
ncbi:MAG: hypothetical protein LBG86_01175, partial [Puniceicoccales bacterium]|nr:hypothetical protein [Puniceicoccales bacterium]